jgi:hypothetical protein
MQKATFGIAFFVHTKNVGIVAIPVGAGLLAMAA